MLEWLKTAWATVRDSQWFVPGGFTLAAMALAVGLMRVEAAGLLWSGTPPPWVYQGSVDGARTVLSAIASSLITVTGVIFSVTIVAVQLASSQYTPRVLRNFSSDRGNQVVLGIFIGTFTYSVLVLRTASEGGGGTEEMVPRLAVTGSIALVLVSVAALIYFIHHVARLILVTNIFDRITRETVGNVHQLFPEHIGRADDSSPPDPRLPEHSSFTVCAAKSGYIQFVHQDRLFALGRGERVVIGMKPKMGEYVLAGRPLAAVWTGGGLMDADLERRIRGAFVLGPDRTPHQDVEFGMVQISDIAIRALSPSTNDPTTAIRCIDRLAEILAHLAARNPPEPRRTRDGRVCFIANYTTFDVAVKVVYDDIRHFGAGIPLIAEHLLEVLGELILVVPEDRHAPLAQQARAVLHGAREQITNPRDLADVEAKAARLSERTGVDLEHGPLHTPVGQSVQEG
jgi:uncharacterized membrane protein